ncbi:MAG: hypothetical protein MJ252_20975, partial [archaeon]|nr:hypothetical protein [archaeon]
LNIPIEFKTIKEYAEQKISRPSDNNSNWKTHWNRDKLAISNNLYIMCENATKIMKYYSKKVKNTSYVVLETDLSYPTKKLATFQDAQNKAIERQKEDVVEEWNKYVANILRQQKIYKDQLILYFKSISGMMSCQLRNLIMNSANHFYEYIQEYKKEKYQTGEEILKDQFNPDTPFEKSFLEVDVIESDDLTAFELSENQGKIKEAMIKTLTDIIDCSKGIGRPFNTFIKQIEKHENLWEISAGDEVVNQMIKGIEQVVEENLNVIYKVTDLYQPFVFAMKEKENLKEFVQRTEPKITRDEVRDKIAGYEAKLKELSKMPEILYMNMVKINCGGINQIIRNKLTDSVNYLLKFIRETNLVKAGKELQEKVSEMFSVTERQITTEMDVNKSEKDLDTYQDYKKKYFDTYNEIIEWLFFYLNYDTYNLWGLPKEEQTNSKINSFDIIKKLHEYINRVDKTLNDFNDKINAEKTKLLNKLMDEKKIFLQKVDLFKKELERFRGDLKQQRKSMGNKEKGSNYTRFFELLLDYKTTAENFDTEFKILDEKEVLLTGGNFEDESTKQCLKLLEPIIAYFRFEEDYLNEYKKINETEIICLKLDDLTEIVKRDTVYDNEGSRLSGVYKDVSGDKKRYEERFKIPYNIFKLLYPLIEINKKRLPEYQGEELTGDDNDQLEDNALYFHEIVQIVFDEYKNKKPEESQDMVIHLTFKNLKDLTEFQLLLEKTEDVQPIMEEWQTVSQMYIDKKNIRNDFSKEFIIEKYKGKEFHIIQEENLNQNLEMLRKIIEITKEKLSLFREETMSKIRIVENFYKYKETAENILGVLIKIKEKQSFITEILDKPQILKSINKTRSGELFRRAQTNYKHMIEMLDIEGKDILALYTKKKEFDSEIEELSKIIKEIQIQS